MSHEAQIHTAQVAILRELLFHPAATYTDLQRPTGLSSDHFNFHIRRLVELNYVEKVGKGYKLTPKGKEYANKLDTDSNTIERQPKVAVLLAITRKEGSRKEYLFQERLKHPYYGYWGFPTGKIRWGETILQTAARELMEETGLTADHELAGLYHEHSYQEETGELLEDKMFFVVRCTNTKGELIERFEGGRNRWMSPNDASQLTHFKSMATELDIAEGKEAWKEEVHQYKKEQF